MKIYPNKSNIVVTKNINPLTDIALSYVDTQRLEYRINTIINKDFQNKVKREILPYEKVNKNIICLFDKLGNQIDPIEMTKHFKREDKDYVFVPYNSTVFEPRSFEYNVVAKKNISYNSRMQYDIKVASASETVANSLMPIFGDAPFKEVAPSNILINSGSMSYTNLVTNNYKDKDIFFISLRDLETDELDEKFDKEKIFRYKTNVFSFMSAMFAEDIEEETVINTEKISFYQDEKETEYIVSKPRIYEKVYIKSSKFFTVPNNTEEIKYHNLFNSKYVPILIEEHVGKGFMVYASDELLFDTVKFSNVIYEIIFYIYSKAYAETGKYREWITDVIPDFIVVNNKMTKKEKFISSIELNKMFGLQKEEIIPYDIQIDKEAYPFVKFTGMSNNYLAFEKDVKGENEKYKDPVRKNKEISIFTSRQDIIYFNEFIYIINDQLNENIKVDKVNNFIRITAKPFKHSDSGIYLKDITILEIPLSYRNDNGDEIQITNADYYLTCKQNESASYLEYKDSSVYKKDDGLILATIQIRQDKTKTLVYDMRQLGGGVPEDEEDNYNCFDIGHIFGRPYRKGGTLIVRLPKSLEKYKERIEESIKRYCVAEEYPIVIFEEEI